MITLIFCQNKKSTPKNKHNKIRLTNKEKSIFIKLFEKKHKKKESKLIFLQKMLYLQNKSFSKVTNFAPKIDIFYEN